MAQSKPIIAKGNCYRASTRTPLIMRWPGRIDAGRVSEELVSTLDLAPTILENGHPDMPTASEESFGPVAILMRAESMDEALEWINTRTNYGHSACIFTESGKAARRFVREADVGNVGVNLAIPQPFAFFPLGSRKDSFLGSAKSRMASMRPPLSGWK